MGGDSQEWVQKRIRPEVFPPVDAAAEVLLHPAGSGVLAAADEFSVNIHLIPGNLIDQHRRPHDFQVVGSLHSCVHFLLLRGAGKFHIFLCQFTNDLLIGHGGSFHSRTSWGISCAIR